MSRFKCIIGLLAVFVLVVNLTACPGVILENISILYGSDGSVIGAVITFSAVLPIPEHQVNQYIWEFGDGTKASGRIVIHSYDDAGTFEVCLTIVLTDGSTIIFKKALQIGFAGHMYWSSPNRNSIGRTRLDGTESDYFFVAGASNPRDVAVSDEYIYWTNRDSQSVGRAKLDGTNIDQYFIALSDSLSGIAISENYIYWGVVDSNGDIGRANIDGTGVIPNFVVGAGNATSIAVTEDYIFWLAGLADVMRANIDGNNIIRMYPCSDICRDITVSSRYLYSVNIDQEFITRSRFDGSDFDFVFIPDAIAFVDTDGKYLYWNIDFPRIFRRADLDGQNVLDLNLDIPQVYGDYPSGIAVGK